jgi:hypothetical protein
MKLKKTTLLIIGAILLWGAVAIWNGIERENAANSAKVSTTSNKETVTKGDRSVTNGAGRVNIATH